MATAGHLERVVAVYRGAARTYDLWAKAFETETKRVCLERCRVGPRDAVVDLGVGTGHLLFDIARRNREGRCVGLDVSEAMLARARRRLAAEGLPHVELLSREASATGLAAGAFDVVVSTFMLELVPAEALPSLLDEVVRLLSPGGRVVLAGVTAPRAWRHGWAGFLCERNPAWAGGFDVERVGAGLEARGVTGLEVLLLEQRWVPSAVLSGWLR